MNVRMHECLAFDPYLIFVCTYSVHSCMPKVLYLRRTREHRYQFIADEKSNKMTFYEL